MSRYNTKAKEKTVTTHQGGVGFQLSDEAQLMGLLATGLDKTFYEKSSDRERRLVELMNKIATKGDEAKYFLAQAIIYARTEMGQRTVTHRAAVEMARIASGQPWAAKFFSKRNKGKKTGGIVYRMDDMLEITAAYKHFNNPDGKLKISNAMKKGFANALESADAFELARYKSTGKDISLIDMVNLTHPTPRLEMQETFKALMADELKQFGTSESKNSDAGQKVAEKVRKGEITKAEAEEEVREAKADNFRELIETESIGYLQLLRNLRNIIKVNTPKIDEKLLKKVGAILTNQEVIKRSLVFPHQIDIAVEIVGSEMQSTVGRKLMTYLDKAYEMSCSNLAELGFDEHSVVVIDSSGSMSSSWCALPSGGDRARINKSAVEKAALIGATLGKAFGCDVFQFSSICKPVQYNPMDSVNTIKEKVLRASSNVGYATNFESIFQTLSQGYKRIFIISDMQGGDSIVKGSSYQKYKSKFGIQPYIYSIDLVGYGTSMFKPNDKLIQLYGYGKDIYEFVKSSEVDPELVLKEVKRIKI